MYPYDEEWEQELSHEQMKAEFLLEAIIEANTPYQLSKKEEEAYNSYMEGTCTIKPNVHTGTNINSSNGQLINGLKLRKRNSRR